MKNLSSFFTFLFFITLTILTGCSGDQDSGLQVQELNSNIQLYKPGTGQVEVYKLEKNQPYTRKNCEIGYYDKPIATGKSVVPQGEAVTIHQALNAEPGTPIYGTPNGQGGQAALVPAPTSSTNSGVSSFDWGNPLRWLALIAAIALVLLLLSRIPWGTHDSNHTHNHHYHGTRQEFVGLPANSGGSPQQPPPAGSWNTPIGQGGRVYEREHRTYERFEYPTQEAGS